MFLPNKVFNNLYRKLDIYGTISRKTRWSIVRTGFKPSFVSVVHIPGSQNAIRKSVSMETTKVNKNTASAVGLSRASDIMLVRTRLGSRPKGAHHIVAG